VIKSIFEILLFGVTLLLIIHPVNVPNIVIYRRVVNESCRRMKIRKRKCRKDLNPFPFGRA
jgi:hypothetical protein